MRQIILKEKCFTYSGCFWDSDMKLCSILRIMVLKASFKIKNVSGCKEMLQIFI